MKPEHLEAFMARYLKNEPEYIRLNFYRLIIGKPVKGGVSRVLSLVQKNGKKPDYEISFRSIDPNSLHAELIGDLQHSYLQAAIHGRKQAELNLSLSFTEDGNINGYTLGDGSCVVRRELFTKCPLYEGEDKE